MEAALITASYVVVLCMGFLLGLATNRARIANSETWLDDAEEAAEFWQGRYKDCLRVATEGAARLKDRMDLHEAVTKRMDGGPSADEG